MPTKTNYSAPLPSAPFRFATLTSTARWGGGQNKTPTINRKRKVPNLFQDLTETDIGVDNPVAEQALELLDQISEFRSGR